MPLPSSPENIYGLFTGVGVKIPGLQELVKLGERIQLKGRMLGFFQNGLGMRDFGREEGSRKRQGRG